MKTSIPFGRPQVGDAEIEAAIAVLKSGIFVHGKVTQEFERSFAARAGARFAISVSSCTAGLHLALFANGIGQGARVAVPAMTHVATAHVVELQGGTPVFIDVDPRTGNMDPAALAHAAAEGPLDAIIPVHYLGLPCDMDAIALTSKAKGALLVEDCALALDATYDRKKAGTIGDCGSFSFYPVKHMTSIEGGMVTTNDERIAAAIAKRKAFGYSKQLHERSRPGVYDVDALGFNYRMNEVEAAVGLAQLSRLDDGLSVRKRNHEIIAGRLARVEGVTVFPDTFGKAVSSHYCINIVMPRDGTVSRDKVQDALIADGIGTSIHYPSAVPQFIYYREKYGYKPGQFPVAEWMAAQSISLPVGAHVSLSDAERIGDAVVRAVAAVRG